MIMSPLTTAKSLMLHLEGLRLKPYRDTVGKLTIGVGRNLDDCGISESEAMNMLGNDIIANWRALSETFMWFNHLDDVRQLALLSMSFMGIERLMGFTRMLSALSHKDYEVAALQALDSKWATQVGDHRAQLTAKMFRTGELPDELK